MELTPQDLWTLRNIAIRAVKDSHEVLAAAARRAKLQRTGRPASKAAPAFPPTPPPPAPDPTPKIAFTIKEASAALGISRSTIYALIANGQLPTLRIGNRRLIEVGAVEAFLESARKTSSATGARRRGSESGADGTRVGQHRLISG